MIKFFCFKVAGTHPDLAPDVEMKLSFPKAKGSVTLSTPESKNDNTRKENPEVFYYKNNQLLPSSMSAREMPTDMHYERYDQKPYYNHRRSLSLARIDSGMSGNYQIKVLFEAKSMISKLNLLSRNDQTKVLQSSKSSCATSNSQKRF